MFSNIYNKVPLIASQKKGTKKKALFGIVALMSTSAAMAQSVGGLCAIAGWVKTAAGVVALIAIGLLVINSFFGKSEIVADIVTKVLIGCTLLAAGAYLISTTGLVASCTPLFI